MNGYHLQCLVVAQGRLNRHWGRLKWRFDTTLICTMFGGSNGLKSARFRGGDSLNDHRTVRTYALAETGPVSFWTVTGAVLAAAGLFHLFQPRRSVPLPIP
jgi:hypothetical protein